MFDNETIMVSTIMSNSTYKNLVFAGVVFHLTNTSDGGLNVTYKLRFPAEQHWVNRIIFLLNEKKKNKTKTKTKI